MSDRDARLLPRLVATLETLLDEGDIVNTVRRIRTTAPGFFQQVSDPTTVANIPLDLGDRELTVRLRALGTMLRMVTYPDPELQAALQRSRQAMIAGTNIAPRDLVITLACMRDVLLFESERARTGGIPGPVHRPGPRPRFEPKSTVGDELRTAMDALAGQMRRPL